MKRSLSILQLGTWPMRPAVHGGQRRVLALYRAYQAQGLPVAHRVIYQRVPGRQPAKTDLLVNDAVQARIHERACLEDVILGESLLQDAGCRQRFLRTWEELGADILQLEGPYLWASVRHLIASGQMVRPRLIYSAHNVEWEMKAGIYASYLPAAEAAAAGERVCALETDLVRTADLVIAVSTADAARFTAMGCRRCLVLRNGGEVKTPRAATVAKWHQLLSAGHKRRHALFVSSWHLPNLQSFRAILGPHLGYLPPDAQIIVAGGICGLLRTTLLQGPFAGVNASRLLLVDGVADDDLAALLQLAQVVLLPIASGGGSNLKTVEALLNGRPILATSYAFRSYEDFRECPGVQLADEPSAFQQALARLLSTADKGATAVPPPPGPAVLSLTWDNLGLAFMQQLLPALAA